jgi:hypothetical protein
VHSLDKGSHDELLEKHSYINLTYHDFLLPLLGEWSKAAIPENIRYFLDSFRHRLED